MENTPKHIELFDKYSFGTLTNEEEALLNKMLEESPELKLEFESHKLLVQGIKEARKQELKDYIKENGEVLYFQNIWGSKWRKASAAIVVIFACTFFLVEYVLKKEDNSSGLAFEDNKNKDEVVIQDSSQKSEPENTQTEELEEKEEPLIAVVEDTEAAEDSIPGEIESEVTLADDLAVASYELKEEQFDIAQETKIKDTSLTIYYATATIETEKLSSLSKRETSTSVATVTLNDNAKKSKARTKDKEEQIEVTAQDTIQEVPLKNNTINETLAVEFWKSPLNFEGYKFQNQTLILYGVTAKDVKIISYNDKLYLKMSKGICKIKGSSEYLPFNYITDKTILNQLNGY